MPPHGEAGADGGTHIDLTAGGVAVAPVPLLGYGVDEHSQKRGQWIAWC